MVAEALKIRLIVEAGPPTNNVPFTGLILGHDAELTSAQFNECAPALVKEKLKAPGLNGPPGGPLKFNGVSGVIRKASGGASSASIKALPVGVPQPVQRS